MRQCAFVTGGSGFLGGFVVRDLLAAGLEEVIVLMRGQSVEEATARLRALWCERPELLREVGERVQIVCGDICIERLGMETNAYHSLAQRVTHIVHAAAEIGVNETAQRFGEVNVDGTLNVLLFAGECMRIGRFQRLVHVSTAYVAGTREGLVFEGELVDKGFNSLYEQSKFGAEQLVRSAFDAIPTCVVRPALIVGDSTTGFAATFNTLYYPLKLYLKGQLPVIPVSAKQKLNMVPVDFVAQVIVRALLDEHSAGKTFHAVVPASEQPTAAEMLAFVRSWAKANLQFDPGAVRFAPVPSAAELGRARNLAPSDGPKKKSLAQNMLALAPYFTEKRTYDTTHTRELMGEEWPRWQEYLPQLLAYATRKGFLNYTDRTVFQQMLVRLSSKRNTLTYYDVSSDGMIRTEASEVKNTILRLAGALHARGIGVGDRVVLVGVNSTRYFMADAAVGLVGATSVPLYYTSPTSDIVELSRGSGAKLAFVGTRTLVEGLPGRLNIPMVSLLDEPLDEKFALFGERSGHGDGPATDAVETTGGEGQETNAFHGQNASPKSAGLLVGWNEFLASASPLEDVPRIPFDTIATIRCTSGTTGKPKGVMFDQYQLRWMGEVMPALLDWRTRNSKLRYLSFLPMSHVVEGILVAYAPYYILSDIEMYYLNDFGALVEALPQVRPTLFFSVPRFYEKVWNQFAATAAGRFWISLPDGTLKRLLAAPLRRIVLRKAGLDRCRQLIVGSAPIGMELLESFRNLGIEIHNAFGVTEAPLITLSRLGNNELGSVGALLPNTQAHIGDDGQVYVRGPQVTRGYDSANGPAVGHGEKASASGVQSQHDDTFELEVGDAEQAGTSQVARADATIPAVDASTQPSMSDSQTRRNVAAIEPAVDADGWFCTGDLASWSPAGNLVLNGRKKEILVTSYGKNIAPQKIEVLLKGIDGVSEAMVVADGRPFTTALIWLEGDDSSADNFDFDALDVAVCGVNAGLSHPEQVKRWIVAAQPLSVANGELTPNLKVRRTVVAETRAELVHALYDGWDEAERTDADSILHRADARDVFRQADTPGASHQPVANKVPQEAKTDDATTPTDANVTPCQGDAP